MYHEQVPGEQMPHEQVAPTFRTLGHGTLDVESLVAVARGAGVSTIVDVRRFPGSRRHPQYSGDAMAEWLPEHGIEYRWLRALGGRRRGVEGSPNVALRNPQLRAYADHMATEEFARGVADLTAMAGDGSVAVLCAESVWWRCHRRLLADHLVLVEEMRVEHVFHDGRIVEHPVTPKARREGDHLVYDLGVPRPLTTE